MEHYKISMLLSDSTVSKFVTKKLIEVNDLSGGQCSVNKNIRFKLQCCDHIYVIIMMHILLQKEE